MSKQGKDKWDPHDPSEPSTSGYRKPYSRSSEHERRHSSGKKKDKLKSVSKISESEYDTDASTSTYSRQYGSEQTEIKSEPMEVKSEPVEVKSESMDIKSEDGSGDAKLKSEDTASTQGRKRETIFVSRPKSLVNKKGTSGKQILVQSNHFKLPTVPDWNLYMFRIDFEPDETRTVVRKGLLKLHKEKIGPYIFDGTVLYTVTELPDKMELISTRKSDNAHIKITIRFVGSVLREDPHYIVFFNIVMRKCLEYLQLQLVGRNYYDAKNKVSIRQFKLELWPGYVTAIRQYERDFMMCVEISHKVLRQETLMHILTESYGSHDFRLAFSNTVIGMTVLTDYNNHTYRVEDVDFDVSPSSKFPMKSGEEISYLEYYWTKYKIRITNPTQPLLVTRTKPKVKNLGKGDLVYLIPELCRPIGLTEKMKEQFHLMRELATHTRLSPETRIDKLMRFNDRLRREDKVMQELNDWHMKLDRALVEVPARILPSEKLIFGRNVAINTGQGDWTRDMQRAPLLLCKELRNWVIIVNNRAQYNVQGFLDKLFRVSNGLSFRIEHPQVCTLNEDSAGTYIDCLERILSKNIPDLVFCVVSNNRSDRYAAIKKKCCIDRPVPSQIILQKNLDGKNAMTIATKIAIQMNCKLGGAPWQIDMPCRGLMAIGFDVCRDSNVKGKEYLAMVATVDHSQTRYFSYVSLYHNHEELGEQLCEGVRKAVHAYRVFNKALPMYLLIYRDGVSDGQLSQVNEYEVESLKKKLEELYYGPHFKMTFIVVSKNNTRLFLNRRNPPTGTIVDDVVTCPFKYDFFLVSQQVRQGTISPTAYNVISDNSGLHPDVMQIVTFKLTHMYYNCSSTVRAPAPCHYAKKFSSLVGRVLHRPPGSQLQNQLFFL